MTKLTEIIHEADRASLAVQPFLKTRKSLKTSGKTAASKAVAQATAPQGSDPLTIGELTALPLDEIVVEGEFRKDLGDLGGLARSMRETGLLQPPIVDPQRRLVCGYRRLRAAQSLGWTEMPVRIVDIEDVDLASVAEGAFTKSLSATEKYAVAVRLRERAQQEGWRKRALGGRLEAAIQKGRLDEEIGRHVHLSRETLRKLKAIHEAGEADPTRFVDLLEALDRDGKVDRHYRELERRLGRGDASAAGAIVVSPGWESLYGVAEANEVGKFFKASLLANGAGDGTVLVFPSSVAALGLAASLVRQGGFEWRTTLRGSGAAGEDLWLVGVQGRKAEVSAEATELIAEACLQGASAVGEAMEVAFEGEVRALALSQEAGE